MQLVSTYFSKSLYHLNHKLKKPPCWHQVHESCNIIRTFFVIYSVLVSFKIIGAKLSEDSVNDPETCSSNIRLYFCMSHVHSLVFWMNEVVYKFKRKALHILLWVFKSRPQIARCRMTMQCPGCQYSSCPLLSVYHVTVRSPVTSCSAVHKSRGTDFRTMAPNACNLLHITFWCLEYWDSV
jgi:hypothetical protein